MGQRQQEEAQGTWESTQDWEVITAAEWLSTYIPIYREGVSLAFLDLRLNGSFRSLGPLAFIYPMFLGFLGYVS